MSIALRKYLPFLEWLPEARSGFRNDFTAGLTGAILVLPQGVAFAAIAGMPPQYGLYAAMIPAIIAALFGSSRHLVSGPTTAASIVLFSALSQLAEPGTPEYVTFALTLTFMVGVTQVVMGLARLGTLVNFISHSVIVGFTAGAAILIAGSQLKHFFDLTLPSGGHLPDLIWNIGQHIGETNGNAVIVGAVTLATGILLRMIDRKLPYMIVAMVSGSLAALLLNQWPLLGEQVVKTVGALPASLPPLSSPNFSLDVLKELAPAVLATTLFALTEAVSISRSLAARSGQAIDGNQEFIGQGLSNVIGSFFSAYVATGSFNRSGVNYDAGAKTPMSGIIAAFLLMGIVLLVAPLAAYLPKPAMAGILFLVAWGLIDWHHIHQIIKTSVPDAVVMGITFAATLLLELEFAILLGVLASLAVYLSKTSRPRLMVRVPDPQSDHRKFTTDPALPECPQLRMFRLDGSIWFGAVSWIGEQLRRWRREHPEQKHLMLLAQAVNFVDAAGAELLAGEAEKRAKGGGALYLYKLKSGVCEPLTRGDYYREIGAENTFDSKSEALATIVPKLDPAVCARCNARIFRECADQPGGQSNAAASPSS